MEVEHRLSCNFAIVLENVKTPTVSGRAVTIEADCDIDLVRYSESITVSPKARVGRTEQI